MMTLFERDYLEVSEAFQRIGMFRFLDAWTGGEIAEEKPGQVVTECWLTESPEQDRYKRARLDLFEELYEGRIKATGINRRGSREEIPAHVWKDLSGYQISIRHGRITCQETEPPTDWRVRIDRDEFQHTLLSRYLRLLPTPTVTRDGIPEKKKPGEPGSINWREIDPIICEEYWSEHPPQSKSNCAERVITRLGGDSSNAPHASKIRDRISMLVTKGLVSA